MLRKLYLMVLFALSVSTVVLPVTADDDGGGSCDAGSCDTAWDDGDSDDEPAMTEDQSEGIHETDSIDISDLSLDPDDPALDGMETDCPPEEEYEEPPTEESEEATEEVCEEPPTEGVEGTDTLPEPPVETDDTSPMGHGPRNQSNEPPMVIAALMPPRSSTDQPGPSSDPLGNPGSQPSEKPSLTGEFLRAAGRSFVRTAITNVVFSGATGLPAPVVNALAGAIKAKGAVDTVRNVVSFAGGIRNASVEDVKRATARFLGGMTGSAAAKSAAQWKSRRTLPGPTDSGLKAHAEKHEASATPEYLAGGQRNIAEGRMLKGGGRDPNAQYWVRQVGPDEYSVTIADKKGIRSIDTWKNEKSPTITKAVLLKNLEKSGVTPPTGFLERLKAPKDK